MVEEKGAARGDGEGVSVSVMELEETDGTWETERLQEHEAEQGTEGVDCWQETAVIFETLLAYSLHDNKVRLAGQGRAGQSRAD
jgi:hypothetical protein